MFLRCRIMSMALLGRWPRRGTSPPSRPTGPAVSSSASTLGTPLPPLLHPRPSFSPSPARLSPSPPLFSPPGIRFTERPRPYSPCSVFMERRRRGRRAGVGDALEPSRSR
ncbi:hypothetical protein VPH35_104705 [Triticum aestivum]